MRVVDLSSEIAGGYCTKILTDAGADVVKVESASGDPLRRWVASGRPLAAGADSPLFQYLHASKRSIIGDRAVVDRWIADADVVVTTGLIDVDEYLARNGRLVVVSITPWGASGPWRDRPATEFTEQAG